MKFKRYFYFLLTLILLGCSGESEGFLDESSKMKTEEAAYETEMAEEIPEEEQPASADIGKVERQIIKTARLQIEVKNYDEAKKQVDELITKYNAYTSSEDENNTETRKSNTIVIRVPKSDFDSLLNSLAGIAKEVESKSVNAKDVTEEFVDIKTRLKNKRKVEERYVEILQKAETIEDILRVEEHLRQVREEIEAKEGRLKFLKDQVALSTITLYMYEFHEPIYSGFGGKVIQALSGGWKGLLQFIVGILYLWPLWLIGIFVFMLIKKMLKKRKQKKQEQLEKLRQKS